MMMSIQPVYLDIFYHLHSLLSIYSANAVAAVNSTHLSLKK